jgi:hypothetical protein
MDYQKERQRQQEYRLRARGATWKPSGKPCTLQFNFDSDEQQPNGTHLMHERTFTHPSSHPSSQNPNGPSLAPYDKKQGTRKNSKAGMCIDDSAHVRVRKIGNIENSVQIRDICRGQLEPSDNISLSTQHIERESIKPSNPRPANKPRSRKRLGGQPATIRAARDESPSGELSQGITERVPTSDFLLLSTESYVYSIVVCERN